MSEKFDIESISGMAIRVYNLCQKDPRCRSDDKWLIWRILAEDVNKPAHTMTISYSDFVKASKPETIRRTRQKLQQHGYALPDEKVQLARQELAEAFRPEIKQYTPGQELLWDRLKKKEHGKSSDTPDNPA